MKLTVYFDGSFWCGLVEVADGDKVKVLKHVFGPEPKDPEIWSFVNQQLLAELTTVPSVKADVEKVATRQINPKRLQRLASKEKAKPAVSTKAQAALQAAHEIKKTQRKQVSKAKKQAEQKCRFEQKQAKKLQKKKGH